MRICYGRSKGEAPCHMCHLASVPLGRKVAGPALPLLLRTMRTVVRAARGLSYCWSFLCISLHTPSVTALTIGSAICFCWLCTFRCACSVCSVTASGAADREIFLSTSVCPHPDRLVRACPKSSDERAAEHHTLSSTSIEPNFPTRHATALYAVLRFSEVLADMSTEYVDEMPTIWIKLSAPSAEEISALAISRACWQTQMLQYVLPSRTSNHIASASLFCKS